MEDQTDDIRGLIDGLCTWAGMIMEDVSSVAILPQSASDTVSRVEKIRAAAADIAALGEAAAVLLRRGEVPPCH